MLTAAGQAAPTEEEILETFKYIDYDGNGKLDETEFEYFIYVRGEQKPADAAESKGGDQKKHKGMEMEQKEETEEEQAEGEEAGS